MENQSWNILNGKDVRVLSYKTHLSMEGTYIGQAKAVYQNSNKDTRDFEKRKSQVFTKAEHEAKVELYFSLKYNLSKKKFP